MAEVWQFDECLIRTGTSSTGSRIDAYAEDVNVDLSYSFKDCADPETGQVFDRIETGREANMTIGALWAGDFVHTNGQPIRVYFTSSAGVASTYQMGSAFVQSRGWSMAQDALCKHDVKIVGANYGTV